MLPPQIPIALSFAIFALAARPPLPLLIGSWGQNLAHSQYWDAKYQEPSLSALCSTRQYNVYHINGILSYAAVNGLPGLDLSSHCSFPNDAFPGWPKTSENGFSLINCPGVGKDIKACQAQGKKVLLTINPTDFMSLDSVAPSYPLIVAQNIWNLFLGGSAESRPFGAAIMDGIDLHIWNNDLTGVIDMAAGLRKLMGPNYLLTITVRCLFPDYIFSPTSWPEPEIFDYVTVYFIQSPNVCGYRGNNPSGFWSSLSAWSNWSTAVTPSFTSLPQTAANRTGPTPFMLSDWSSLNSSTPSVHGGQVTSISRSDGGPTPTITGPMPSTTTPLPLVVGLVAWPTEAWAQAAAGDYVPATSFIEDDFVPRVVAAAPGFAGVALQDVSYDAIGRPCIAGGPAGAARTYSDVVWAQLVAPAPGRNSSSLLVCRNESLSGGSGATDARTNYSAGINPSKTSSSRAVRLQSPAVVVDSSSSASASPPLGSSPVAVAAATGALLLLLLP